MDDTTTTKTNTAVTAVVAEPTNRTRDEELENKTDSKDDVDVDIDIDIDIDIDNSSWTDADTDDDDGVFDDVDVDEDENDNGIILYSTTSMIIDDTEKEKEEDNNNNNNVAVVDSRNRKRGREEIMDDEVRITTEDDDESNNNNDRLILEIQQVQQQQQNRKLKRQNILQKQKQHYPGQFDDDSCNDNDTICTQQQPIIISHRHYPCFPDTDTDTAEENKVSTNGEKFVSTTTTTTATTATTVNNNKNNEEQNNILAFTDENKNGIINSDDIDNSNAVVITSDSSTSNNNFKISISNNHTQHSHPPTTGKTDDLNNHVCTTTHHHNHDTTEHNIHNNKNSSSSNSNNNSSSRNKNKNNTNNNSYSSSSSYFKFNERKFFSPPTFKPDTKDEAFRRIYAAIEEPMKRLENDGYEAYKQYLDDCNKSNSYNYSKNGTRNNFIYRLKNFDSTNSDRIKKREESIRKSLRDALVNGDPREYQRTIYEVAKKRNTIVNLGTGSGKTLIALLLIRDIWSSSEEKDLKEKKENKNKQQKLSKMIQQSSKKSKDDINNINDNNSGNNNNKINIDNNDDDDNLKSTTKKGNKKQQTLFLVPSVALAIQQSLTLRANLPRLRVETACYASTSSKRARISLGKCDIIVATHGAIQDLLMHYGDTFSMERFNLVVIDECHYAASGNHTYRHLMEKFYHTLELERRPRILGLTASPLLNVKESHSIEQLKTMLDNLESTLDSKLVSAAGLIVVEDDDNDTTATTTTNNILNRVIDERALNFCGTNTNRSIPSADNLDLLPSRYREFKQLEHLYKDLGPLVLTIYCAVLRRELSRNVFENESSHQFDRSMNHLRRIVEFCDQEIMILPNNGRNDKLLALEELIETLIEEKGGTNTIGLVFVERRITALALHCYFLWRHERIADGKAYSSWLFGKQARRQKGESDTLFKLKSSRDLADQGDDRGDDRFDDSTDDPMYVFQQGKEEQDTTDAINLDEAPGNDDTDLFHIQSMDAESDSEDENEGSTERNATNNYLKRSGRVSIKTVALVRNPVQIFNSLSMAKTRFKESEKVELCKKWIHKESNVRDVLSKLRRGDFNLMFATSVVEEGVDVQACSFVVVFDGLISIKGYIQMKGRARKQDAKFFVFGDPHDDRRSKLDLCVAQRMERKIQNIIEQRMGIYAPTIQGFSSYDENNQSPALSKEIAAVEAGAYKVGDAIVDIQSAKSLLNRYFLSIPLDPFDRCKKESLIAYMPCFETDRLVLPIHLPSDIRNVILPTKYKNLPRRETQKVLSLMACVRLQCNGLLNERLLPLTRKDMQSHILKVATQKLEKIETSPLNLDDFYSGVRRHLIVYPLKQESSPLSNYYSKLNGKGHSLGLITTAPIKEIKPFPLYHAEFGEVIISVGEPMRISCSSEEFVILQQMFLLLLNERWCRRSRNIFYETRKKDQYNAVNRPYLVGVLSSSDDLDWDFMMTLLNESNRPKEERTRVTREVSSTEGLPEPRIWRTSYNESIQYVVFGPSGKSCGAPVPYEKEGVNTYCDYYKQAHSLEFPQDCPLFQAQRIWSLPSGLPTKSTKDLPTDLKEACFDFVNIPQQAFFEDALANAHIASLSIFLPQILFLFERQQKTVAFIEHCERHISTLGSCFRKMDFGRVAIAITAKSCSPDINYDKWEYIGDAVLKLLQTDSLLKSPRFKHFVQLFHEGDLSMLRSAMGTNERLKQICNHFCLEDFIMMTSLSRGKWIPSPLKIIETIPSRVKDTGMGRMKILADVIESILGIVYLDFGYHITMKVGNELRVTLPWDETDISVAVGESGEIENSVLLNAVEMCTGAKAFNRPKLVDEAFTHPSAIDAIVPSYQRLEWIGDSVLCLCAREWLYKNLGEVTLGDLVLAEGAIVSNETLGFVSMKYGLQQYLNHRDQSLPKRIESYCWNVQEGCGLWGGDPPKPIADIVEAVLGAVHVDSDFESGQAATMQMMSPVFSVFKQTLTEKGGGIDAFLKVMKHPKKSLQEMTGQLLEVMVCSEHEFASSFLDDDEENSIAIPQILHKDEWRNPMRGGDGGRNVTCYVSFVSLLGFPLVVVAGENATVARNKASSLVREAIERHSELKKRIGTCRSKVESGLTFAIRNQRRNQQRQRKGYESDGDD